MMLRIQIYDEASFKLSVVNVVSVGIVIVICNLFTHGPLKSPQELLETCRFRAF